MLLRRRLTSLAPLPTLSLPRAPLLPPYSHSTPVPAPANALKPPYEHQLPLAQSRLGAKYSLRVLGEREGVSDGWREWAKIVDRRQVGEAWVKVLRDLKATQTQQIPEISLQGVSDLSFSVIETIRNTGSVVVRDVVPDAEAAEWARDVLAAMEECDMRPIFWHPALLEARANPSILSTTAQLLRSLTGTKGSVFVQASSIQDGLSTNLPRVLGINNPWSISQTSGSSPLTAHLALSPSTSTSALHLPPTIHSALYSALRPFFQPVRSKISFYSHSSSEGYLDASNWTPVPSSQDVSESSEPIDDFPHLEAMPVGVSLNPGDLIIRHSSIPQIQNPTQEETGQLFLPVSPLARTAGNEVYVKSQKEAFEAGLPPPGSPIDEGMAVVEERGNQDRISSRVGREAMGY